MNAAPTIKQLRLLADKLERGEFELVGTHMHCDIEGRLYTGRFSFKVELYDPTGDETPHQAELFPTEDGTL